MNTTIPQLVRMLPQAMGQDRLRLARRLETLGRQDGPEKEVAKVAAALARSVERRTWRLNNRPAPTWPEELPVVQRREEIRTAIVENQVVIVAGETGSGKTTQLPKICLEAGRGIDGMVGHTQPRRIAARSLSERIAEELDTEVGKVVGCKMRFSDRTHDHTFIKVMTDGILLAETRADRELRQYDTILIDEAHERSLNIDFLLGYIKNLLPGRPDLKLVITSATIETERFAAHFGDAPVIEVSGRTYPVEVRYRPPDPETHPGREPVGAMLEAVDELWSADGPGDTLIFLSGERKIREAADAFRKHHPQYTEVVPLFARLSSADQARVFHPGSARRIILATNVAETSVTVPRIRYVIDPGYARISRYSTRARVQRLPVEEVSKASADQRKGRCGRVADGICVRLCDEASFDARPAFTEPEIRRTGLAAVILRMLVLELGDIADFPFLDPPDRKQIADGYALLLELGAVDGHRRITALGKRLSRFNVDPRIARMILAAERQHALAEVLVIAAALSVPDPRERPADAREKADAAHAPFRDRESDFAGFLKLWDFFAENSRHLSQNKLRKLCKEKYLNYPRLREWRDIHRELSAQVKEQGMHVNGEPATPEQLHTALLTGLLSHVGRKVERREYAGARGSAFTLFPGSGLKKKPPEWLVAAEVVETEQKYARTCAKVAPEWIEKAAGSQAKTQYSDPHWDKRRQAVAAWQRVTLYGLELVARRKANYAPKRVPDPDAAEIARDIFIREGLAGEADAVRSRAACLAHNRALMDEAEDRAARSRDAGVDTGAVVAFYEARIPPDICNTRDFEKWRKTAEREDKKLLFMRPEDIIPPESAPDAALHPDHLEVAGHMLPLSYHFKLGHPEDGVTAMIPLSALPGLAPGRFEWLVPGMLRDKVGHLLKTLPKRYRKQFMPWPRFAGRFTDEVPPCDTPLTQALGRFLLAETGQAVPEDAWAPERLPEHLKMRFVVVDEQEKKLAEGRDLAALQERLAGKARERFETLPKEAYEQDEVSGWQEVPASLDIGPAGGQVHAFPALTVEGSRVALRLYGSRAEADHYHREGVAALLEKELATQYKTLKKMTLPQDALLAYAPLGSAEALKADITRAALAHLSAEAPRTAEAFAAAVETARSGLIPAATEIARWVADALVPYHGAMTTVRTMQGTSAQTASVNDMKDQLDRMIHEGFAASTPYQRLGDLPRYLKALNVRMERCRREPRKDAARLAELAPLWHALWERMDAGDTRPEMVEFRWLLEELRVSLFAQEVGTKTPVSVKRLGRRWEEITA